MRKTWTKGEKQGKICFKIDIKMEWISLEDILM